jgi:hypothetical protein
MIIQSEKRLSAAEQFAIRHSSRVFLPFSILLFSAAVELNVGTDFPRRSKGRENQFGVDTSSVRLRKAERRELIHFIYGATPLPTGSFPPPLRQSRCGSGVRSLDRIR